MGTISTPVIRTLPRSLPRGEEALYGLRRPGLGLIVVVLDGFAAEWTSRAIAPNRSRWHCGDGSSPLRESCRSIRLEASG